MAILIQIHADLDPQHWRYYSARMHTDAIFTAILYITQKLLNINKMYLVNKCASTRTDRWYCRRVWWVGCRFARADDASSPLAIRSWTWRWAPRSASFRFVLPLLPTFPYPGK